MINGIFLGYCVGAGMVISRLTRNLPPIARQLWLLMALIAHVYLATFLVDV